MVETGRDAVSGKKRQGRVACSFVAATGSARRNRRRLAGRAGCDKWREKGNLRECHEALRFCSLARSQRWREREMPNSLGWQPRDGGPVLDVRATIILQALKPFVCLFDSVLFRKK